MSQINVTKTDENTFKERLYGDGDTIMKQLRITVPENTMVRVSKVKGQFENVICLTCQENISLYLTKKEL